MSRFNHTLPAFCQEMRKNGAPALLPAILTGLSSAALTRLLPAAIRSKAMQRGLGGLGQGAGVGGLVGGAAGTVVGGVKGYRRAEEEGRSGLVGALGGAGGGALKGALIGSAAGAAGLGAAEAAGKVTPGMRAALEATPALRSAGRFGQRQVHSVTGWTPKGFMSPEGARQIGAGGSGALTEAQKMGLTSIPGYAKALYKDPGKTLKTGFGESWGAMGKGGKALMFGLPAGLAAKELATESEEGGPGRLTRAGKQLSGLAYAAAPMPLLGSGLLAGGLHSAIGAPGAVARKFKRPKTYSAEAPPSIEPAGGDAVPTEYEYSGRAMGQVPEIGSGA